MNEWTRADRAKQLLSIRRVRAADCLFVDDDPPHACDNLLLRRLNVSNHRNDILVSNYNNPLTPILLPYGYS